MKKITKYILIIVLSLICVGTILVGSLGVKDTNALELKAMVSLTLSGDGTINSPYLINNISEFNNFRDYVNAGNTMSGKYIRLENDLDFQSQSFTPLKSFKGGFFGNNYTIQNLANTLFDTADNATITNFSISYAEVGITTANGGIVLNTGTKVTISHIFVYSGSLNFTSQVNNGYLGGIVGKISANSSVIYCENYANISASANSAGGLIGTADSNSNIEYCANYGSVQGGTYVGGIVGYCSSHIYDSFNKGSVTSTLSKAQNFYVGGIVGYGSKSVVSCYNTSTSLSASNYSDSGGGWKQYSASTGFAGIGMYSRNLSISISTSNITTNVSDINGNRAKSSISCYGINTFSTGVDQEFSVHIYEKDQKSKPKNDVTYTLNKNSTSGNNVKMSKEKAYVTTNLSITKNTGYTEYNCKVVLRTKNGNEWDSWYLSCKSNFTANYTQKKTSELKSLPRGFSSSIWFCSPTVNNGYPALRYKYWEGQV